MIKINENFQIFTLGVWKLIFIVNLTKHFKKRLLSFLTTPIRLSSIRCFYLLYFDSSFLQQHVWPAAMIGVMQQGFTEHLRTTDEGHHHLSAFYLTRYSL